LVGLFVHVLRLCQEDAERARANAAAAQETAAAAAEQAELRKKAEAAEVKAGATKEKTIEAAANAGLEPPDMEPLASVTRSRAVAWPKKLMAHQPQRPSGISPTRTAI